MPSFDPPPSPTGVVWGRQDRFVPRSLAERASARLEWPLQVVEETGHATHVERPEAFLNALVIA